MASVVSPFSFSNVFEANFSDIAKRLERTYNIDISIHHPATANKRFYGTFSTREQSYTDILQALKETGTLKYTIRGRHIDIY